MATPIVARLVVLALLSAASAPALSDCICPSATDCFALTYPVSSISPTAAPVTVHAEPDPFGAGVLARVALVIAGVAFGGALVSLCVTLRRSHSSRSLP